MKIYIMRHGVAESGLDDANRALTPEGRQAVGRMAAWAAEHIGTIPYITHSAKTRTRETAEIMAEQLKPQTLRQSRSSLEEPEAVAQVQESLLDWEQDALIVGHLPFVAQFLGELVVNHVDADLVRFTPGTIVCLEAPYPGKWSISWVMDGSLFLKQ